MTCNSSRNPRREEYEARGRVWFRGALGASDLAILDQATTLQSKPGQRLAQASSLESVLSAQGVVGQAVARVLPDPRPVRTIAFNKSRQTNWGVPWHQDRVIAVAEKHAVQGFGAWSNKAGIWHCEPPADLLDRMVFVRVHLDDCDADNGAMEIAHGSHRAGIVKSGEATALAAVHETEVCAARRGDVLLLKMLTLHRSLPSSVGSERRVLRIDYAAEPLPAPLEWAR